MKCKVIYLLMLFLLSLASIMFAQEQEAPSFDISEIDTTLWKYLRAADPAQWDISQDDSVTAFNEYFLKGYKIYREILNVEKSRSLTDEQKNEKKFPLLLDAKTLFEEALLMCPFLPNLKNALRAIYSRLNRIYGSRKMYRERYEILQNLLILEKKPENERVYHILLGNTALATKNYALAIKQYNKAVNMILRDEETKIDSTALANALFSRAICEYRLLNGENARKSFRYAFMVAPEKMKKNISIYLKNLEMDDGNIRAVELLGKASKLKQEKNFEKAADIYEKILKDTRTIEFRRLIQFQLARLEFYDLNRREDGVTRIWIQRRILNSIPDSSAKIDSTRKIFNNYYADMCFRLATDLQQKDRRKAFSYFYEVSTFDNPHRARSLYFLAYLAINNDQLCIEYCKQANKYWDKLGRADRKNLSEIYYNALKNNGDFEEAVMWYKRFLELSKNSSQGE